MGYSLLSISHRHRYCSRCFSNNGVCNKSMVWAPLTSLFSKEKSQTQSSQVMCPSSHHLFLWNCDLAQADFQSRSGAPDFYAILPPCSATWQSKSYCRWENMSPESPDEMMLKSEQLPLNMWSPGLSFLVSHSTCWETVLPSLYGHNFSAADYKRGGTGKWDGIGMKKHGMTGKSPRQPIMNGHVVSSSMTF